MAQGWKQAWRDLRASLKGETAEREQAPEADATIPPVVNGGGGAATEPETGPRRRDSSILLVLAFSAVVCTIGIGLAAWILIPYYVAPSKQALSEIVATFKGGEITLGDVEEHLGMLPAEQRQQTRRSNGQLRLMVEEMISDRMVLQWAAERRPEAEESFQHAVQHADQALSLTTLSDQIKDTDIVVAESEIRRYFDANAEAYAGRDYADVRDEIRRLLVEKKAPQYVATYLEDLRARSSVERNFKLLDVPPPTEDEVATAYRADAARYMLPRRAVVDEIEVPIAAFGDASQARASDILLRIRGGATFRQMAQDNAGVVLTAGREVAEGASLAQWDANVFALAAGELAGVFRTDQSYHVVRLDEMKPARPRTLAEVRGDVVATLSQAREEKWFADNGPQTLFSLKGQRYGLADFYREYSELPEASRKRYAGPAGMRQLADNLIDRMLLVGDTYDKLVDVINQPRSEEARIGILKLMMEQEEVDDAVDVSEAEIEAFYSYNRREFVNPARARIRYVRIGLGAGGAEAEQARQRAQEAYEKLVSTSPSAFADIARDYSEDPDSSANGGMLADWVGENGNPFEDMRTHPFHEAVLKLEPGQVNAPFEASGSLYVVEVLEKVAARPMSYMEARPMISEALLRSRHRELASQFRDRQMKQYEVNILGRVLDAYVSYNQAG